MAPCICVMPPADRSRPGTANICIAKPCNERQGLVRKRQSVNKTIRGTHNNKKKTNKQIEMKIARTQHPDMGRPLSIILA